MKIFMMVIILVICCSALSSLDFEWINPYPTGNCLRDVQFIDTLVGWFVGDAGTIVKTTDGGENWSGVSSLLTNDLYSLNFANNDNGWIVGECGNIFNITNQGSTWERKNTNLATSPGSYIGDAFFLNDSLGWLVGDYRYVFKTTDGGETFDSFYTNTDFFKHIFFIDENKGCIAGMPQDPPDMGISNMYTTDGGVNWNIGESMDDILDIFFISESLGWAVGGWYNKIYRTTDLGSSWDVVYQSSFINCSVHFVDCAHGWVVGSGGNIIVSSDSGTSWIPQTSYTTETLISVFFLDLNYGYAAGENGTVVKTTDGGNQWTVQTTTVSANLNKIVFLNPDTGWAVGDSGVMVFTRDGGITWIEENSKTNKDLLSITLAGSSYVWMVGDGAVILRANIGSVGISEQNPGISVNGFQINYPSVICNGVVEFEISVSEDCNLKIDLFNIAGQRIGIMLDQRIYTGSNKFSINISESIGNVSRGIYFLNITIDSDTKHFQQRNKLMLIN